MVYTPAKRYPTTMKLRNLSKQLRGLTKAQRAVLVADALTGTVAMEGPPSQTQLCALAGISIPYAQAAKKLTDRQRAAVWSGVRPLVPQETASPKSAEVRFHEAINDLGLARAFELFVAAEHAASTAPAPHIDDDGEAANLAPIVWGKVEPSMHGEPL